MLWGGKRDVSSYCHLSGIYESIYYGLSTEIFPAYFCLVCRSYTASLGIHTEHSRKDLGIFCKADEVLIFWTEGFGHLDRASTSKPAVNEEKLPNTQSRMFFRDCRQTVLLLVPFILYFSLSDFPAVSLAPRKKLCAFPWDFCGFPLTWKDSKNYSSSLKKIYFVIDTLNVRNKEMLLISWLLLTGRDECYMVPVISTHKTSVIECFELERILEII